MTEKSKAPWHLWAVGGIATLWNAFGAMDYFMTRTRGAAWIDQMMPGVDSAKFMTYIDAFPIWASIGWALGVWLGLAGSVLLLMRSRHAVATFGVSLAGAAVGIGYQLANPVEIAEMTQGVAGVMGYIVIAIAAALFWYARRQRAVGVLG